MRSLLSVHVDQLESHTIPVISTFAYVVGHTIVITLAGEILNPVLSLIKEWGTRPHRGYHYLWVSDTTLTTIPHICTGHTYGLRHTIA